MSDPHMSGHRRSMTVAALGTVLVVAYSLLAALQILVLNPLASVPGKNLGQIYAGVAAAGETMGAPAVITDLLVGPAIAITLLVLRARRRPVQPARSAAIPYLALLVLGAPAYFWASFGPGMSLADTFMIDGYDHSPWAQPLYVTSGLALVALVSVLVSPRASTRRGRDTDRPAVTGLQK